MSKIRLRWWSTNINSYGITSTYSQVHSKIQNQGFSNNSWGGFKSLNCERFLNHWIADERRGPQSWGVPKPPVRGSGITDEGFLNSSRGFPNHLRGTQQVVPESFVMGSNITREGIQNHLWGVPESKIQNHSWGVPESKITLYPVFIQITIHEMALNGSRGEVIYSIILSEKLIV